MHPSYTKSIILVWFLHQYSASLNEFRFSCAASTQKVEWSNLLENSLTLFPPSSRSLGECSRTAYRFTRSFDNVDVAVWIFVYKIANASLGSLLPEEPQYRETSSNLATDEVALDITHSIGQWNHTSTRHEYSTIESQQGYASILHWPGESHVDTSCRLFNEFFFNKKHG